MVRQVISRKNIQRCENCEIPCYFDNGMNRWMSDNGPMFTGRHCTRECYQEVLRTLELEFTLNSENRTNIVRRLNMYRQMDKHRCKVCGSVSNGFKDCWCE